MPDTSAPASTTAESLEEIRRLALVYALSVDQFQLDRLLGLWSADATFDQTRIGGERLQGIASIQDFFEVDFAERRASAHFVTNHVIELDGPGRAHGTCYAMIDSETVAGAVIRASALYTDSYVHSGGRWLFTARAMSLLVPVKTA